LRDGVVFAEERAAPWEPPGIVHLRRSWFGFRRWHVQEATVGYRLSCGDLPPMLAQTFRWRLANRSERERLGLAFEVREPR